MHTAVTLLALLFLFHVGSADSKDVVNLNVPMIHQRWDVPAWYDGSWGCGPTSATMAIAYHKKLAPIPISCPLPNPHHNNFGWYLPNNYTVFDSMFDRKQMDPQKHITMGAYGWCTNNGGAEYPRVADFISRHKLTAKLVSSGSTFTMVKAALDRGHPVVLDTRLTSAGHIILVRGYDDQGNMIVNDPYGDAHDRATYGKKLNGENKYYTFEFTKAAGHWLVEVSP